MIVFDNSTGKIITSIPDDQDMLTYFYHYPQEFKDKLSFLKLNEYPKDLENYKVVEWKLVRKSEEEIKPPLLEPSKQELRIQELEKEVENLTNTINTLFGGVE